MADEPREGGDAMKDIAEAVTLLTRAAGTALDRAGQVVGDALFGLGGGTGSRAPVSGALQDVRPLSSVAAGEEATMRVSLANGTDAASEPFVVTACDLVSEAGDTISADAVSLGTEMRVVAAHATETVQVSVKIPSDAKPGVYKGEVHASDDNVASAPLSIDVR